MATTLSVNSSNDLFLDGNGNITIATGLTATLQNCQQAAKTLRGEMFMFIDQGIPFDPTIWNGVLRVPQFEAALRGAFLSVSGVIEVVSLVVTQIENTLEYVAVISTIYGGGTING